MIVSISQMTLPLAFGSAASLLGYRTVVCRGVADAAYWPDRIASNALVPRLSEKFAAFLERLAAGNLIQPVAQASTPSLHGGVTTHGRGLLAALDNAALEERLARCDIRRFTPCTLNTRKKLLAAMRKAREDGMCFVGDCAVPVGIT